MLSTKNLDKSFKKILPYKLTSPSSKSKRSAAMQNVPMPLAFIQGRSHSRGSFKLLKEGGLAFWKIVEFSRHWTRLNDDGLELIKMSTVVQTLVVSDEDLQNCKIIFRQKKMILAYC
ncbi:hypothetical protein CEXT_41671 [Caerostris extrusa]|uniref:Uncharacterized protein n=1 Tax=Caerostris extrusa TaxID=172846 RepID=A0AAV4XUS6_CAEEX|nr:hypothetical protein CEXT_41671 [Caerostris extrusa]